MSKKRRKETYYLSVEILRMDNKVEIETITNSKGFSIPKHSKDFKKLVEKDRELAEYLCMNYESLDSEDLGAFLWMVEQGISWILDLIESKDLLYKPRKGKKAWKRQQKKSLAQILVEESKRQYIGIDIFSIPWL